ncbi:MAG: hypothetical protein PHP92_03940 [Candidatus Nanoarchaeia archaeon]|nr:hypothetical protein [Candidatus Nanoarchaeia archaeon]
MGHQIIKQPNNLFCIFSSIVDDFIVIDADEEGLIEYYIQEAKEKIEKSIRSTIKDLNEGKKIYGQLTMTYDEAVKWRDEVHNNE